MRELTPATSYGFEAVEFARDVLKRPFHPWQEFAVVHGGELLPDGRPRFRIVLIIVARQQGKTEIPVLLSPYWLFVEHRELILGTSTNLDYSRESWEKVCDLVQDTPDLAAELPKNAIRKANGEQTLTTVDRCRYKIATATRRGGRSLTVHRFVGDELREHQTWDAYNAAIYAMNAVPDAQAWLLSNMGDDQSIVLDSLRASAIEYIETGQGDPRLGIFEWSAPPGSDPTDPVALAMANPNAGGRTHWDDLLGPAKRAKDKGGLELTGFQTEVMCLKIRVTDPAINAAKWAALVDPIDLAKHRDRTALCFDLSPDELHASIVAAAMMPDGRVALDVVDAWSGPDCTRQLRAKLPGHVNRIKPRAVGYYPSGPAAAVAADMSERRGWPPRGVKFEEIRSEITACCMGLAELVRSDQIAHPGDDLLTAHVLGAEKLHQGDAWRFVRRGVGHCDAAYAAAGSAHLARTLPAPAPKPRLITSKRAGT